MEQASESALFFFAAFNSTSDAQAGSLRLRLSRSWSFPLLMVFILTIVLFVLHMILSQFITNPANIDVFKVREGGGCGCACVDACSKMNRNGGVVSLESDRNRMKPAFTELALKKIHRIGTGRDMISDFEIEQGWTIVRDRSTQVLYKAKCWQSDGVSRTSGIPHKKGDIMRVYDDISQTRLATYSINANPRYRAAVRGLHLVKKRTDDLVEHFGSVNGKYSLDHKTAQKHLVGALGRNRRDENDVEEEKWKKKTR